jgi:methylmalonyl-CoA mutase cobalamin-binding domain/chain
MKTETSVEKLTEAVLRFDQDGALKIVREALSQGVSPYGIIEKLRETAAVVGERYESGEYFVSDLIMASSVMKSVAREVTPLLTPGKDSARGKVVIGSAPGDLHDIGKDLMATLLIGAGFEVTDLGVDVPTTKFVEVVKKEKPQILGVSGLTSATIRTMKDVIEALKSAGLRDKVKVILGGAPITQDYAESIGADAGTNDGVDGLNICKKWMNEMNQ